jgi:hypothetical protein
MYVPGEMCVDYGDRPGPTPNWGSTRAARMPKLELMAQISRPFQIALLALLALAMLMVTWFMLLHRSNGTASSGTSSPSVAASASGSATHAITRPSVPAVRSVHHVTVAPVKPTVHSAGATQVASGAHHTATAPAKASTGSGAQHRAASVQRSAQGSHHAKAQQSHTKAATGATAASVLNHLTEAVHLNAVIKLLDPALKARLASAEGKYVAAMRSYLQPASQATVAAELNHRKTVLLLFLNPAAYDDDAVAIETVSVAHKLGHSIAVHFAQADQVNSFGSITRDIPVYQTPTLLIITHKRQVTTLTGLTDHFAIEQAVAEARG